MTPDQFDRFSAEQRAAQHRAGEQAAASVARIRTASRRPAAPPIAPKAATPTPQPRATYADRRWMWAGILLCLAIVFGLGFMLGRLDCHWGLPL